MTLVKGKTQSSRGLENQNPLGSKYASKTGKPTTEQISKEVRAGIFDAAPKQYFDLKLAEMATRVKVKSDEIEYDEMGYQRSPLFVKTGASAGAAINQTTSIIVTNASECSENTVYILPDGTNVTLKDINETTGQVTVVPQTGESVPAISAGSVFAQMSPLEADGTDTIAQYFRAQTITRDNYVMLMSKGRIYGAMEWEKIKNKGRHSGWLEKEWAALLEQQRLDISNAIWMSKKGEVTLPSGLKAKQMNGIWHSMKEAGSPSLECTKATIVPCFEQLAEITEFGSVGETRFVFATTTVIRRISEAYKGDKTRYNPNDRIAALNLNSIDIGSSNLVLVPFNRFKDEASFPKMFQKMFFIIDWSNIEVGEFWAPGMIANLADERGNGGKTLKKEMGVTATITLFHNNPLSCGYATITDM